MKFSNKFPNIEYLEQVEFEGSFLIKADEYECWNCSEPTHWIDGCFEAHLCSEECSRVKWNEYFSAAMTP